jgi:hypothetical protein
MIKSNTQQTRNIKKVTADHPYIPSKFQHPAAMLFLYLCLVIFFHSVVFEGKTYQSADTIASHSWETLLKDAQAEGIYPLWNPYIFCGMPGFASLTFSLPRTYDLTTYIWGQVRSVLGYLFLEQKIGVWLLFYLVYGIGIYLFVFSKLDNKPIALLSALMATYATYFVLLIMIGHVTKIAVVAWFPYIFLIVEKLREKFNLLFALLLTIFVRLLIEPGHVQFIFYVYLALGSYLTFLFIRALIKKENWKGILLSGISLICATIIAFLMGADQHLSTLEYNPYSMRGSNPITHTSPTSQTKTIEGGLDYDYATNFSFGPGEIMTFFIPSWYGFGPRPYQGPLTQNQPQRLNFYWGPQPWVDGPQYMGVVVVVLAIIGFFNYRKTPFIQFMGAIIIVALFIAFGKELPIIYDLMYRYFPMFNKFRVPLLSLMLVQFFIPILAGYGITSFVSERKKSMDIKTEKKWKYTLGGLAVFLFITFIGSDLFKGIYSSLFPLQDIGKPLVRSIGQQNPIVLGMVFDFVFSTVITDIQVALFLFLVVFGTFYYYQKGKISSQLMYSLLIIVVLFDLWRIGFKSSEPRNSQESLENIETPNYVKFLLQDTTQYRVLRIMDGQPVYDNTLAYWRIKNAYGYQGAKIRIYQDMVDVAGIGNPLVWQMMNVKYLISNRDESNPALIKVYDGSDMKIFAFRAWLEPTFFVKRVEVSDGLGILNKIAALSFDPRDVAYVTEEVNTKIDPPMAEAKTEIIQYGLQNFTIRATSTGNNLLFISEAYYPKGWKAYIDGDEVQILQLNYLFRGIVVPQGTHKLEMKFEPTSFSLGRQLSFGSNILVLAGIIIQLGNIYRKKRNTKIENVTIQKKDQDTFQEKNK